MMSFVVPVDMPPSSAFGFSSIGCPTMASEFLMASSTAFLGLPNKTDKKAHVALETAHHDSSDTVEHPDLFKCAPE